MKKAYLVDVPVMVRIIADENATFDEIVRIALEIIRQDNNHITGESSSVEDDQECPYDPETE